MGLIKKLRTKHEKTQEPISSLMSWPSSSGIDITDNGNEETKRTEPGGGHAGETPAKPTPWALAVTLGGHAGKAPRENEEN